MESLAPWGHHLALSARQMPMPTGIFDPQAIAKDPNPSTALQRVGLSIIAIFPMVSAIFVGLRLFSRVRTRQFWFDDGFICAAMTIAVPQTVATYMFAKTNYIGIHLRDIPPHDPTVGLKWNYLVQVFYHPILALVKSSALMFLLRLGRQKPGVKRAIHTLNAFNLALMVAITLTALFQCSPVSLNWDLAALTRLAAGDQTAGVCIRQAHFYLATAGLSIFTDVLVLGLPFWIFLDLKMARRVKIAVMGVFLLGSIVTIVSVGRLYYFGTTFFRPPGPDPTYSIAFVISTVETNLAIICACAPALRGLARSWFPSLFPSSASAAVAAAVGGRYTLTSWSVRSTLKAGRASQVRRMGSDSERSLRGLQGGDRAGSSMGMCCRSPNASEVEVGAGDGILCRTDISVRYEMTELPPVDRLPDIGLEEFGIGLEKTNTTQTEDYGMRTSLRLSL